MEILDLNKLSLFIFFFVPGFISMKTWRLMVPAGPVRWNDSILEAISYSCINFAAFSWVFILLRNTGATEKGLSWYHYLLVVFSLFLAPVLWPIALRWLLSCKRIQRWVLHPTPTAWDRFFGQKEDCWVLVHLKTGRLIGGKWSQGSYASAYPELQDLYLTEVWKVDEKGVFVDKVERSKGMWISKDSFDYLEFFA